MLHFGNEDLVTCLQSAAAVALRDQVDRFGRPAHEHDLARACGVDEPPHLLARDFVGLRRTLAQIMNAAMNVGVEILVVANLAVDDRFRLLGRRGVVEVD